MLTTRYGLDIPDVVARERRLARRATAFRLLTRTAAAAGALGAIVAFAATGDGAAALAGSSPLVLALAARVGGLVSEHQLRRAGLLLTVLEGVRTRRAVVDESAHWSRAPEIEDAKRVPAGAAMELQP